LCSQIVDLDNLSLLCHQSFFGFFSLMIVSVSSGLDTFSRESETNEPAEMLVEDTSQSQGFAPWVDGSQSVENMVRLDIWS